MVKTLGVIETGEWCFEKEARMSVMEQLLLLNSCPQARANLTLSPRGNQCHRCHRELKATPPHDAHWKHLTS